MIDLYKANPYLSKVVEQSGYTSLKSLIFLYWLVRNIDPKYVLEFGTGFGCSAIFMALGAERGKIISIDDYRGDTTDDILVPKENTVKCGVADKIQLIAANTKDTWVSHRVGGSPEIVFMDASHYDADLQQEYATLKNIIAKDHIIIIDDILAQDEYAFVERLSRMPQYISCSILDHHFGVAILHTNISKYFKKINDAMWRSYNV